MADLLTTSDLATLRSMWVFDRVDGSTYLSVFNKRYARQFFTDSDLQAHARRARMRWGEAIGDGVADAYSRLIHQDEGVGFTAQPNNGAVHLVSSSAADIGIQVALYGTTFGTSTVVKEIVTLNGTTPVTSAKVNWGKVLAAVISLTPYVVDTIEAPQGTITITTTGGSTITTLGPSTLSSGYNVAATLIEGFPVTTEITYTIPEVGLKVFDDDVTIHADAATTATVGLVGVGQTGEEQFDSKALIGTEHVRPSLSFTRIDGVLVGDVPLGLHVTMLAQHVAPYEAQEVLFCGVQVLAFEAYLGSDEYTAALEDKADQVRRAWESRITSDLKKLNPIGLQGGSVPISR